MIEPEDRRPVRYLGGPVRQFLMRYPYWVAGALGVLYITLSRPCTRYIPEPPPVLGVVEIPTVAEWVGASSGAPTMDGDVWIVAQVCVDCDGDQSQLRSALEALAPKLDRLHQKPIKLLALLPTPETGDHAATQKRWADAVQSQSPKWHIGVSSPDSLRAWAASLKHHFPDHRGEFWRRLVLLDGDGALRGSYAHGDLGIDEAYHRAQHVVRQARELAREKSR